MAKDSHEEGASRARTRNRRGGVVKLTPAEAAVVSHLSRGLTNPEIADALGKSPNTVKSQLAGVYRKLGVHSRIRLMVLFRP